MITVALLCLVPLLVFGLAATIRANKDYSKKTQEEKEQLKDDSTNW